MVKNAAERPLVIAGPCVAESLEMLKRVALHLTELAGSLDFELVFKASFDKANRSAIDGYRGPGLETCKKWFAEIKHEFAVPILTDIHESWQAAEAAEVCDYLQIPAFLCRQTDLLVAAVKTGRFVNIKKGQFMAPQAMHHIVDKARCAAIQSGFPLKAALTERGASFGYGNLVVDMRSFQILAQAELPVLIDITHSTQLPPAGDSSGKASKNSGAERRFAPLLARAATATGHVDGYFMEVHPDPANALSDAAGQLSLRQASLLLEQVVPFWRSCRGVASNDSDF